MSWTAVASLGLNLLQGASSRSAQKAQNLVMAAQAEAENIIRDGRNQEIAAFDALDKWVSSENNRRMARAGGEAFTAAQETLKRTQDDFARSDLERQIASAEAAGAFAANAAQSGTAGSSMSVIAYSIQAQQERQAQYQRGNQNFMTYDQLRQIAGIKQQTLEGLEIVGGAAGLDRGITLSKAQKPQGNWLLDAVMWATGNPTGAQQLTTATGSFFSSAASPTYGQGLRIGGGGPGVRPPTTGFWAI